MWACRFAFFWLLLGPTLSAAPLWGQATFRATDEGWGVFAPGFPEPVLFLPFSEKKEIYFLEGEKFVPRVRFSRGSFFFKKKKIKNAVKARVVEVSGPELLGNLGEQPFRLHAEMVADSVLRLTLSWPEARGSNCQAIHLSFGRKDGERFLGLGEQPSYVEVSGKKVPVWVEEQGIGRGDRPLTGVMRLFGAAGGPFASLSPLPIVHSTAGRLYFVHGHARTVFDFSRPDRWSVESWQDSFCLDVYLQRTPLARLEAFTAINGRPPKLPNWVRGNILGVQGGPQAVRQKIAAVEAAGAKVAAIWIQDWVGRRRTPFGQQLWWYWRADSLQYPELRAFIAEMNARGIKVLGYINPFMVDRGPLFDEARRRGFFVKKPDGSDYLLRATGFEAALLDPTHPGAAEWVKTIIREELLGAGFSGWMADFGEWLPFDARLHDGRTGAEYHNHYPVDWARLNREAIEEAGMADSVAFFVRSGHSGSARYAPFFWAGDQNVNFGRHDGIGSVVPSLLSSGLSGHPVNHGDVGGFTMSNRFPVVLRRSRELLQRWMELGALSPVFRTHEGLRPGENVQVYSDTAMTAFYAKMARLRAEIAPDLQRAFDEAAAHGLPVARYLWLHYPGDAECIGLQDQYLLGPELLVAPVVEKGAKGRRVYFPGGTWRHLLTGQLVHEKGWLWIGAPLGTPPVFRAVPEP